MMLVSARRRVLLLLGSALVVVLVSPLPLAGQPASREAPPKAPPALSSEGPATEPATPPASAADSDASLPGATPDTGEAGVQPDAPDDPNRWHELAYGITLLPPPGALQFESSTVAWADPAGYKISFDIVYFDVPLTLEQVAGNALVQMGFARASPRLTTPEGKDRPEKPRAETLANRPGIQMFFDIEEDQGPGLHYGQAIIMLEPYAAAVLLLEAHPEAIEPARRAFADVLDSVHVPLAVDLDAQREARVNAADQWLRGLTPQTLVQSLPAEQWFRLLDPQGQDLGHLRLRSTADPEELRRLGHEPPGVFLRLDERRYLDGLARALDTRTDLFVADDNRTELWDRKSTLRPARRPRQKAGLPSRKTSENLTWTQVGVRGDRVVRGRTVNAVTVVAEFPPETDTARQVEQRERALGQRPQGQIRGRSTQNQWAAPDRAYLNQILVWLLPELLPRTAAVYHFSAYHPPAGKPGLRTVEVRPQPDGSTLVSDRPNSRLSPIRTQLAPDGRLVHRLYPDGKRLVPTTPQELAELWDIDP
ncbi:MAG: hypothetical protein AAGG38_10915 [Planctomycetota bacterium]